MATPTAPLPTTSRRRPHPRLDQAKRTWYFFRRNTLALVGLGIIVAIALIAIYAATLSLPWSTIPSYCATDYGPGNPGSGYPGNYTTHNICHSICTYEVNPPPNAAQVPGCNNQWYKTPLYANGTPKVYVSYAGAIAPTLRFFPSFSTGPMPLGGLTTSIGEETPIYDVAGALARGSDWTLMLSVSIVGLGAVVGLFAGAIAGFYGGVVDDFLMRFTDVFLSIPTILFVIVMVTALGSIIPIHGALGADVKLLLLIIGFVLVWWPIYARIVRGQVLVVREQKYVEAARASGASKGRTLLRHIIPNSMYPIFIQFSLDVGTIPLLIGALVFLGFGPEMFPAVPFPEWGSISAISVADLPIDMLGSCLVPNGPCIIAWWQLLFPGLALFFFAISVNLLSDGIRDSLDPRLRR
ncbi:MAG TPA: ABC transporter permease [Thermoplasmata archaeon]|nr:ABC transporter permease [Thermoplasmata archaeon]